MVPRTIVVGNQSEADAPTLTMALAGAAPGDTLVVAPGIYEETVHVDVDVTIVSAPPLPAAAADGGKGEASTDVVRATVRGPVVIAAATAAKLENVEIHGMVSVRKGRATLERCDVHNGSDGVRAYPDTKVELNGCRVHHCSDGGDGVYFMNGSTGSVTDTDIYECRVHGVHVQGSSVALQGNRIRDCAFGVYYEKAAGGRCEANTVEHAGRFGVLITDGSNPTMTGNTVRECGILCLYVSNGGRGICSQNTFDGSVHILASCPIQLSGNVISGTADVDAAPVGGIAMA
jgi:parallel beta-helix repeat protein